MNLPKKRKPQPMGLRNSGPLRVPSFLAYVRRFECAVTTKVQGACSGDIEAAHVRIGTDGGVGQKPSDCFCLPLCSEHHRRQHQIGERSFEKETGISMKAMADQMWNSWLKTPTGAKWKKEHDGK